MRRLEGSWPLQSEGPFIGKFTGSELEGLGNMTRIPPPRRRIRVIVESYHWHRGRRIMFQLACRRRRLPIGVPVSRL